MGLNHHRVRPESDMSSRTRDELIHLLREACRRERIDPGGWRLKAVPADMGPGLRRTFVELVRLRTGRCVDPLLDSNQRLEDLAIAMQRSPRVSEEECRFVWHDPGDRVRRLILLPGLYGIVQAFGRLAELLPRDRQIIGWNYPNQESMSDGDRTIEAMAGRIVRRELDGLESGEAVEFFGYCIGGLVAHEAARQLAKEGVSVPRVTILDGHPGRATRNLGFRTRVAIGAPAIVRAAKASGPLEHGIVQTALAQLKAMPLQDMALVDTRMVVLRTGGELALGPLEPETWRGAATRLEFHRLQELGHLEVFRGGHEQRLVGYIAPGPATPDQTVSRSGDGISAGCVRPTR